jgi:glutamate-ammonia-ligase adenylyltransferase
VFTGSDDDPETLDTLAKLGFRNPSAAIATIRAWHVGRIRATRSARAKEMLTALMPDLLRALSRISDPDATLARFDRFLTGLPAGVQLFSLLYKNSGLLALLADILGTAPRLANFLSKQPSVLDAVLTPSFFERLPSHHERVANLSAALSRRRDFQDILDICRFWTREENFRIGAHVLTGLACAAEAGSAYADIAETVIANMQPAVEAELIKQHGVVPGGEIVVIGMGKLGGREMAANSDLDLIFVYDFPEKSLQSSGPRALASGQYFTRFSQRLINALTVPTAEGALYEVDMRLRPSGNSGPLATQFARFDDYHVTEAWTWEKMALLRARVISGPASLRGRVNAAICKSLSEERNERQTARDVVAMRERLEKQYPSADPWELKYVRGGLIDLEFTCQYLQLIHAAANPGILEANTCTAFDKMGAAGCIPVEEAKELANASDFLLTLMQILRLALDGPFVAKDATEALKGLLARAGGATSFGEVERRLEDVLSRVRLYFNQYVMGRAA